MNLKEVVFIGFLSIALQSFARTDPERDWDWENPSSINLYQYVRNGPINGSDPTGKKIEVDPSLGKVQKAQLITIMQALTGDKLIYKGNEIIIASLGKKEAKGKGRVMGTRLVRKLRHSAKTVTVGMGSGGNSAGASNWTDAQSGKGSDASINFDISSNPSIDTKNPVTGNVSSKKGRAPQIGLGHEMIHADHITRGTVRPLATTATHTYKNATGKTVAQTVRAEELATVGLKGVKKGDVTENDLRKEQKVDERGAY